MAKYTGRYIERKAAKEVVCSVCRWANTENCDGCEHPIYDIPSAKVVSKIAKQEKQ